MTAQTIPKKPQSEDRAASAVIPRHPLRFSWHITKQHKGWAFLAFMFVTLAEVAAVFEFYTIARLVDGFVEAGTVDEQLAVLSFWGACFVGVMFAGKISWRLSGFSGIKWIVESHATAYKQLFNHLMGHSHSYYSSRFAGAISNKVSNAADGAARLSDRTLWSTWPDVISLLVTVVLFLQIHWTLGVFVIVVIVLLLICNVLLIKWRYPYVVAYSAASSKVRGEGVDLLTNISATRLYVRAHDENNRLALVVEDRRRKDLSQWFRGEWIMVVNSLAGFLMIASIVGGVYVLLYSGMATAGSLVLVLMLLTRISLTVNMIGMMMNMYVRIYGEIQEGLATVLLPHDVVDVEGAVPLVVNTPDITFDSVSFNFDEQPVFTNFDLHITSGQRVGLVGQSGAGKTTFVSLLLRQHDLHGGAIKISNQDIAAVTQDSLRSHIALVPQEPLLFHRTIRENIAYGNLNATEAELIAAAKKAQAHDFIMMLPDGYDTLVGERGVKLSGGQKQRVAIARALLKDAPILILDEATSALDSESEVAIQQALETLMEGRTVIAIAHRLSTLRKMDRIIVLEGGKIVEDGTHDVLAKNGGVYQRLWEHQAGGFLQE